MADAYSAVVNDVADFAHIDPFHVTGQFPMTELQVACSLDKKVWRPSLVYNELYNEFPEMQKEYADVKILAFANAHVTWLGSTKKPIRTLEDCKGLKWNGPGEVFGMRAEALGAVPMNVVPPEIYTSTQNGVIDGGVGNPSWLWSFKLGELYKYVTLVPFNGTPLFYAMNKAKWNSLPPDIQKAIEDVSGLHQSERADREEELSYQEAVANGGKDFGIEFITLSPEELAKWVAADKPVIDKLTADMEGKGLPGKKFFEEFRKLETKYSAPEWEIKP
jgi:TRAP-type C4-dicarboxylate transport system substrate-binding protein